MPFSFSLPISLLPSSIKMAWHPPWLILVLNQYQLEFFLAKVYGLSLSFMMGLVFHSKDFCREREEGERETHIGIQLIDGDTCIQQWIFLCCWPFIFRQNRRWSYFKTQILGPSLIYLFIGKNERRHNGFFGHPLFFGCRYLNGQYFY